MDAAGLIVEKSHCLRNVTQAPRNPCTAGGIARRTLLPFTERSHERHHALHHEVHSALVLGRLEKLEDMGVSEHSKAPQGILCHTNLVARRMCLMKCEDGHRCIVRLHVSEPPYYHVRDLCLHRATIYCNHERKSPPRRSHSPTADRCPWLTPTTATSGSPWARLWRLENGGGSHARLNVAQ